MIPKTQENMERIAERFGEAQKYAWNHRQELIDRYKGEHVAILGDRVVGHDRDFDKLWERVNREPYERGDIDRYAIISSIGILLSSCSNFFRNNIHPLEADYFRMRRT